MVSAIPGYLDYLRQDEQGRQDLCSDPETLKKIVMMHRSLIREYFSAFLGCLQQGKILDPGEIEKDKYFMVVVQDYIEGKYDTVEEYTAEQIAKKNSWVCPSGWSQDLGKFVQPTTNLLNGILNYSIAMQSYHHSVLNGQIECDEFDSIVVDLVELNKTEGHPARVYEGIIQGANVMSTYAVSLRMHFEAKAGRPMQSRDWDRISPHFVDMTMANSMKSHLVNQFERYTTVAAQCPFHMGEKDGEISSVRFAGIDEKAAWDYIKEQKIEDFINNSPVFNYDVMPVTGCPVMGSRDANGNNAMRLIVQDLTARIRKDFWPEP